MYSQRIILYGSAASQNLARDLLKKIEAVKYVESIHDGTEIRLILNHTITETSLIPLLCQSGLHGFRLVESND